jgi:hypothetical protein
MSFNLSDLTYEHERIGYFAYAPGVTTTGEECMMVVSCDWGASSCNPYYWTASPHNRFGHEFSSKVEAETIAKHAAGSWSVKSVDKDKIKIGIVRFVSKQTITSLGDAT